VRKVEKIRVGFPSQAEKSAAHAQGIFEQPRAVRDPTLAASSLETGEIFLWRDEDQPTSFRSPRR